MVKFERAELFLRDLAGLSTECQLSDALAEISREMGFRHFALTHHVDVRQAAGAAIRLHNYPADWAQYYDENRLGLSDPIHRASHVTSIGFTWSEVPQLIALTRRDHDILARGLGHGIGDGFTVPAHVPGESNGSCSFANPVDCPLPAGELPLAQLVGSFAFESARRLWRLRSPGEPACEPLTDRQRECIIWVARGKTDWEISRILDIGHETVIRHLKQARERYGFSKRTMLAVHALFDGSISFFDIFRR